MYQARTTLPPGRRPITPTRSKRKKLLILVVSAVLLLLIALGIFLGNKALAPNASVTTRNQPGANKAFNKQQYSTTDPASIWVVANKQHPLNPSDYTPPDLVVPAVPLHTPDSESQQLRQVAATALEQLIAAAKSDGINLLLTSGYRSYNNQVRTYNGFVKSMGQAEADKTSARPGHSEHQTGLAADVGPVTKACELEECFGELPEGKWVAAHAHEYGFIIRYPKALTSVTGYEYEPWHLRFIGTELATELARQHVKTLEEFFGVSGGTNYK